MTPFNASPLFITIVIFIKLFQQVFFFAFVQVAFNIPMDFYITGYADNIMLIALEV